MQPVNAEQPLHVAPEFAGYAMHVVWVVADGVGEYFPAEHLVHSVLFL